MSTNHKDPLFTMNRERFLAENAPLADRMRPRTLDEFCGQEKIVGPGRLLRRAIQADQLSSLIFYGPPGSGKTTLARIIEELEVQVSESFEEQTTHLKVRGPVGALSQYDEYRL